MPPAPDARRWFDEARSALRNLLAWGDGHIADPRFRRNFQELHRIFWGMRLDKVRRDHFSPPWLRGLLKVKSLIQVAWTFVRMMGMYDD